MQRTDVLVAVNGDLTMTVPKFGVTAAEIGVLLVSHGQGSVSELPNAERGEGRVKHVTEYHRLVNVYGAEPVAAAYGPTPFGITLPLRIAEVLGEDTDSDGADDEEDDDEASAAPAKSSLRAPVPSPKPALPAK